MITKKAASNTGLCAFFAMAFGGAIAWGFGGLLFSLGLAILIGLMTEEICGNVEKEKDKPNEES